MSDNTLAVGGGAHDEAGKLSVDELVARCAGLTGTEAEGRLDELVRGGFADTRTAFAAFRRLSDAARPKHRPNSREACPAPDLTGCKPVWKEFSTGSLGWHFTGKVQDELGRLVQVNIQLVIVGSKG